MAWYELILILRYLIGDLSDTPVYTDSRLQELILVGTQMIRNEITFPTTYVIDFGNGTITPDPTTPIRDDSFITLVCYKCAILLLSGEVNNTTSQAVLVRDGTSQVDVRNVTMSKLNLLKFLQSQFDEAKLQYFTSGNISGEIIVTPFRLASTSTYGYPGGYGNYHGHGHGYGY